MVPEKYDREVKLLCPTCGCNDFLYDDGIEETIQIMTCASCGRELNKDELLHENSENIDEHLSEIQEEFTKDMTDEIQKALIKAFSGSKNFRIK